ncbi:hypothetical protein GO755_00250 [Spirosoma sp. HMF4905]|uniref:Uncharacterized protein n=1 Tax=Spirosoma arboris TaxID=2682092 RepID=A0A7K1S3P6_9BACT|nr:hypothetical protein [Spirosoma arboris]MVM28441.1 hypothetical protein [Spirosoma arboris]
MNRLEKIALLSKVLQGGNTETAKRQLTHAMENHNRGLVLIDDLDDPGAVWDDNSMFTFHDKGKDHRMTLGQAQVYAKRNFVHTLFVLPANNRPDTYETAR